MPFRQYTICYQHQIGDKPFNRNDLLSFASGVSAPGIIVVIIAFLTGVDVVGFFALAITYAVTIRAIAEKWLYHRLVCISGDQCAVGTIDMPPTISPLLGEFDNDQFFDIRLMPHRRQDAYRGPNCNYATLGATPALIQAPSIMGWELQTTPTAGPSLDGLTESKHPANDVFLDKFQGSALLQPGSPTEAMRNGAILYDLPYDPVDPSETTIGPAQPGDLPLMSATCSATPPVSVPASGSPAVTRATLHCEAEGNFWAAMLQTAGLQGLATAAGSAAGAAAGSAAGCAIGGIFGGIGCLIGAIIGFIIGLAAGGAAAAYVAANAAFNSDPGDVNDANVGDVPLGTLANGDQVVVYGTHVYDGFHEGWHEFHPLKAILRVPPPQSTTEIPGLATAQITFNPPYIEWDPNWVPGESYLPPGLTATDMQQGLASPAFRALAVSVKQQLCALLSEAFNPVVRAAQEQPQNRWTIHPLVDGCQPSVGSETAIR
jgi:hypothetical protein